MRPISAQEFELLSFFEVAPSKLDLEKVPWPYNDLKFEVSLDQYAIVFDVSPACRDASLVLSHGGVELYSFTALALDDVRYYKDADNETLELVVSDRESVWFKLRPTPSVRHAIGEA